MKKLIFILLMLVMSSSGFAQTFTLLTSDPMGDGINLANDARSLYYSINEQTDSLWFKLTVYAPTTDLFCSICVDNDNNSSNGRNFYGSNTSIKCDRTINIYYNHSINELRGEILDESPGFNVISSNVNVINTDTIFTFNVELSEILAGNSNDLKVIGMVGQGHMPMPNDDIPDAGYLTIPINLAGISSLNSEKESELDVYPNPSKNFVTVKAKNIRTVSIINSIGELIFYKDYKSIDFVSINVQKFRKGIYHLKVQTDNTIQVKSLLIQ